MLSEKEMKKIALNECVNMLGEDIVFANKELCCATYGLSEDGMFYYNLGIDKEKKPYRMGGETPMDFYAFVVVNPNNGKITRDYENSILPN